MTELQRQVRAIRERAAVSRPSPAVVRVTGEGAWAFLDRVLPCELHLREAQLRATLLLRADGSVLADVLVGAEDADFWLFVEGLDEPALLAHLGSFCEDGEDVQLAGLAATHAAIAVDGPYAWEALEAVGERGIGGMPYLSLARLDGDVRCVRAGRTGEYGYTLLVPHDAVDATLSQLGDVVRVDPAALTHCALENWFFDIHAPFAARFTPLELQLQARLSRRKGDVLGMPALAARREAGGLRRTVGLRGPLGLAAGDALRLDGDVVGEVLQTAPWFGASGGSIGMGLLPLRLAHPGLDVLSVPSGPVMTVSAPLLLNRSLLVRPSRRPPDPASLPDPYA